MSAQAGIFYFDGRPVDPEWLSRADARLAAFGPDARGEHTAPGLAMVHRALHVTDEDEHERQPYVSARGFVMTWDGRLDNRDELILALWRDVRGDTTDAALAMAAYERRGEEAFAKLIGDWSLAIANVEERIITLASDFAGARPLYVREAPDHIAWSTSLTALADRTCAGDLDPRFLVGCVTFAAHPESTAYRRIRSVAAGHAETWDARGSFSRQPFWRPVVTPVRYANPSDYAEHLRSLFAEAVRARMRAKRPVWIELSGGFDSSSIACMADAQTRSGAARSGFTTLSYTSDAVRASDERPFIEAVERHIGRRGHHVRLEDVQDLVDRDGRAVTPQHPSGCSLAFLTIVRESSSHVLLSGSPGDLVMGNFVDASAAVLEDLADSAPLRALINLREWSRASQKPIWTLAANLLRTCGARRSVAARHLDQMLRSHGGAVTRDPLLAARELFLLTADGAELWRENVTALFGATLDGSSAAKRDLVHGLLAGTRTRTFAASSEFPLVRRAYPYMHRPLVELVLGIPLGRLCRPGEPRALMREALAPILPDRILARRSKGYIAPFHDRAIKLASPDLLARVDRLHLVRVGIVDPERLRARIELFQHGAGRQIGNLLPIVRFEQWAEGSANVRARIPIRKEVTHDALREA
jgi:asparagine synthase (glutamine-hydrolysing)